MKLKIFTSKSYLHSSGQYVPLLYPFWGERDSVQGSIDYGRFDEYTKIGSNFFSIVSIEQADAVLLPSEWPMGGRYPESRELFKKAYDYKKPIIIFFNNDSTEEIPVEHAIIFRTSFYASKRKRNEFALPGWSADSLKYSPQGCLNIRNKSDIPTVGYCGYVDYYNVYDLSFVYYLMRLILQKNDINLGRTLRGKAVRILGHSHLVNTEFIIRIKTRCYGMDETVRVEYVRNLLRSDYALVVRGAGNFSYRLYEVMSCGRIPLFINSDCVLPFDHIIDWKKFMVWIEADEIENITEKVVQFHNMFSNSGFQSLQQEIRRLYVEWLSPVGFYSNIHKCLSAYLNNR